ncbi:uncharacterized protein LOC112559710 [Pomacea canaliculata]|uniref:uncharacterized protein LOC112559710 n=1 Tax=Pomacea canaliculata TaxID=400727 RepID=UPI000D735431|nr:uncharacterized protein LOC112559710 [Pomacea canaliculata]
MIIRGTAIAEYKERDPSTAIGDSWMLDQTAMWVYTVMIDEVFWAKEEFKGMENITVITSVADNLCGTRFELDVPYIFCVFANNGTFTTGLCEPNMSWDHTEEGDKEFISSLIPRYCTRQKVKNARKTAP